MNAHHIELALDAAFEAVAKAQVSTPETVPQHIEAAILQAAQWWGVSPEAIKGSSASPRVPQARQMALRIAKERGISFAAFMQFMEAR